MPPEKTDTGQKDVEVDSGELLDQQTSTKVHELTPLVNRYLASKAGQSWETHEEAKREIAEIKTRVRRASHELVSQDNVVTLQPSENRSGSVTVQVRMHADGKRRTTSLTKLPLLTARPLFSKMPPEKSDRISRKCTSHPPLDTPLTVRSKLNEARKASGLTQYKIGIGMGLTKASARSTVSKLLNLRNKKYDPRISTLLNYAEAMGCELRDIL